MHVQGDVELHALEPKFTFVCNHTCCLPTVYAKASQEVMTFHRILDALNCIPVLIAYKCELLLPVLREIESQLM